MKKFLFILVCIMTFGLVLVPTCFAKDFSTSQLDNTNRIEYIDFAAFSQTNNWTFNVYFNKDNLSTNTYYLTLQTFNINDLNTPINTTTLYQYANIYPSSLGLSFNSFNSVYNGYRSSSSYAGDVWNSTYYGSYIQIRLASGWGGAEANDFINNYVLQVVFVRNGNAFNNVFVPNTYYNIDMSNELGVFSNTKAYLSLEGSSSLNDRSDILITYNRIGLNSLANSVYSTNNVNSYQYHLYVDFDNVSIKDLPQLNFKYLQLDYITINNERLAYATAYTRYNWLYRNIVMYSDNATLFVNKDNTYTQGDTFISRMEFSLPNYAFKSSSYYDSNYGLLNYLKNAQITTLSNDSFIAYSQGVSKGYNDGYKNGYDIGYSAGVSSDTGGFDALMFSIADVPVRIISSILNFEILGFNLMGFFMAIITLLLFVKLMKKFKE